MHVLLHYKTRGMLQSQLIHHCQSAGSITDPARFLAFINLAQLQFERPTRFTLINFCSRPKNVFEHYFNHQSFLFYIVHVYLAVNAHLLPLKFAFVCVHSIHYNAPLGTKHTQAPTL